MTESKQPLYTHTRARAHTHTHTHNRDTYTHTHTYVCMYVYICVYIYIYIIVYAYVQGKFHYISKKKNFGEGVVLFWYISVGEQSGGQNLLCPFLFPISLSIYLYIYLYIYIYISQHLNSDLFPADDNTPVLLLLSYRRMQRISFLEILQKLIYF